jgi:hypothetical protein
VQEVNASGLKGAKTAVVDAATGDTIVLDTSGAIVTQTTVTSITTVASVPPDPYTS